MCNSLPLIFIYLLDSNENNSNKPTLFQTLNCPREKQWLCLNIVIYELKFQFFVVSNILQYYTLGLSRELCLVETIIYNQYWLCCMAFGRELYLYIGYILCCHRVSIVILVYHALSWIFFDVTAENMGLKVIKTICIDLLCLIYQW